MVFEPLIAADVGNCRIKFGRFEAPQGVFPRASGARDLPIPASTFEISPEKDSFDGLAEWLASASVGDFRWYIGSVQRTFASRLIDWLRERKAPRLKLLTSVDLPLTTRLPRPDMAGIDRLLAAVAVNVQRPAGTPAVIVDLGTAITVDLVSAEGAFLGGAILPGIAISAKAMYEFTDLLPLVDMPGLAEPPSPLGKGTEEAMRSGLFWGAVGGVRHLIELFRRDAPGTPRVFLTGGAAPAVAGLLAENAAYEPHLTLAGIALTAASLDHRASAVDS